MSIAHKTEFNFNLVHVIRIHMYFKNNVDFDHMRTVFAGYMVITYMYFLMQMCAGNLSDQQLRHIQKNYEHYMYMSVGN